MTTIKSILEELRQQSLIIDANNSLGSGVNGAEAFEESLNEALQQIEQLIEEAKPDKVHKEDYGQTWHNSAIAEYYSNLKKVIR